MVAIMLTTWKEIYRKKVFLITILLSLALLALVAITTWLVASATAARPGTTLLSNYVNGSVMFALSLYGANFSIAYLSIFSAAGTISAEIDSGLLLAIMPRPVSRSRIYLGKWLGFSTWNAAYSALLFWSLAIIIHVNMHFPMIWGVLFEAFLIFLLIPLILVSLTMLGSTFMPTLGNGIFVILLYGIGVFGDLLQRVGFGGVLSSPVEKIGFVTGLLMPTTAVYQRVVYDVVGAVGNSLFSFAAQTVGRGVMPMLPSAAFLWYAALYGVVLLIVGMVSFGRRDV